MRSHRPLAAWRSREADHCTAQLSRPASRRLFPAVHPAAYHANQRRAYDSPPAQPSRRRIRGLCTVRSQIRLQHRLPGPTTADILPQPPPPPPPPSATATSSFISSHLAEACCRQETAGPYNTPPFPNLHCSGLGTVPKKNGKLRPNHHLSAPSGQSVNDGISRDEFSLNCSAAEIVYHLSSSYTLPSTLDKIEEKSQPEFQGDSADRGATDNDDVPSSSYSAAFEHSAGFIKENVLNVSQTVCGVSITSLCDIFTSELRKHGMDSECRTFQLKKRLVEGLGNCV